MNVSSNRLSKVVFPCSFTLLLLASLLMSSSVSYGQSSATPLPKSGYRIVFFGDSVTQQGGQERGYITLFERMLQKSPQRKADVINAGISGHKVPDLLARLDKDVLQHQPTHVIIYIGINDVWHSLKGNGTTPDVFEAGLRQLVQKLGDANIQTILCTPSVIGEKTDGSNQLDEMLEQYASITRNVAADTDTPLLDLRKAFSEALEKLNPDNATQGILTRDGVHMNDAGNRLLSKQMLAAFQKQVAVEHPNDKQSATGSLRHIVLFQFKDGTTEQQQAEIVTAFGKLPSQIETITDFEHGTDISPENLAQGFTHCFVVTFKDEAGRDAYLPHPAHKQFVQLLNGKIEKVLVIDYVAK